jgi:hypothetical protein
MFRLVAMIIRPAGPDASIRSVIDRRVLAARSCCVPVVAEGANTSAEVFVTQQDQAHAATVFKASMATDAGQL